jgi:hypothetical protein
MTEAEWGAIRCRPFPAVEYLTEWGATPRKLYLLACGFCRHYCWDWLADARSRAVIEATEQFADGLITRAHLNAMAARAWEAARDASDRAHRDTAPDDEAFITTLNQSSATGLAWQTAYVLDGGEIRWPRRYDATSVAEAISGYMPNVAGHAADIVGFVGLMAYRATRDAAEEKAAVEAAQQSHGALIEELFGNPFRSVPFSPSWRTDTAVALARQMYGSRDFSAMPILADALQDAGCARADILDHCRGPGAHVHGCWVVDLVLGKE